MDDRRPRAVASSRAAIAGIVVYVAIDVALGFLRPKLSVLHNAESDYGSRGRYAWLMDLNFVLRCAFSLLVVAAIALSTAVTPRLRAGLVLLAIWAVASGLLAFFPDDPVGTTVHGTAKVHVALAVIAFAAVIVGTRIVTRALRGRPAWRPAATPLTVLSWGAFVPIVLLGRAHLRPDSLGGLYEKIFLGVELAWFFVAAARIVHGARSSSLNGSHGEPTGGMNDDRAMDTDTIDQEYEKLQTEFQDVAKSVAALADKLQAAAKAGDVNATAWLADLKQIATDIDEEQTQAKVLLLVIHRFISAAAQDGAAAPDGEAGKPPLFAPGQAPAAPAPQPAPVYAQPMGMLGGGGMMGGYFGGGFARAMEMGAGMGLAQTLVSSIFR